VEGTQGNILGPVEGAREMDIGETEKIIEVEPEVIPIEEPVPVGTLT
jgi:hypothetical protein